MTAPASSMFAKFPCHVPNACKNHASKSIPVKGNYHLDSFILIMQWKFEILIWRGLGGGVAATLVYFSTFWHKSNPRKKRLFKDRIIATASITRQATIDMHAVRRRSWSTPCPSDRIQTVASAPWILVDHQLRAMGGTGSWTVGFHPPWILNLTLYIYFYLYLVS